MTDPSVKLKQIRNGHRTTAKKRIKVADELIPGYDPVNLEIKGKLKAVVVTLQDILETLKDLDSQILDKLEEEGAIAKEIDESAELKSGIQESIIKIELTISQGEVKNLGEAANINPTHPLLNSVNPLAAKEMSIKLPRIIMKEFSGNPLDFQSFWDTFAATIDSNTQLSSINKFGYLKGLLRGQAEAAIAGLAMTEDNYKIAVDILKSRFGKVDLIVSAHMDALVGLAAASSSHDIRKVRFIYNSVEKNVRQLQNL